MLRYGSVINLSGNVRRVSLFAICQMNVVGIERYMLEVNTNHEDDYTIDRKG